jgi:hypothetical protein
VTVRLTRLAQCVDLERRNVLDELGHTYWEAAPGARLSSGSLDVGWLFDSSSGDPWEETNRSTEARGDADAAVPLLSDAPLWGTSTSGCVPPHNLWNSILFARIFFS